MGKPPKCNCCPEDCLDDPDFNPDFPECWSLVVAEVANNLCGECDPIYNGVFTLQRSIFVNCIFETKKLCPCDLGFKSRVQLEIRIDAPNAIEIDFFACGSDGPTSFNSIARYRLADGSSCVSLNIPSEPSFTPRICDWSSAVVTAEPIAGDCSTDNCPVCTGPGGGWEVTVAGVVELISDPPSLGNNCDGHAPSLYEKSCTEFNGTYLLINSC